MKRPTKLIEIAKSQPRKTVNDAVEFYKGVWPITSPKVLSWHDIKDYWSWGFPSDDEYQVCTREEFEAEVARRQDASEWTHEYLTPENPKEWELCRLLSNTKDMNGYYAVLDSRGFYVFAEEVRLRGYKPPITKEAVDIILDYELTRNGDVVVVKADKFIKENYEVK